MEKPDRLDATLEVQLDQASDAAMFADATEPRALSAAYDRASGKIVINLKDGSTFMFPHELGQGLVGAEPDELAAVEVTPSGIGLHWEALDVDLTVPSLLRGIYGTKAWMEKLKQKQNVA
ncbi:MAG: DUF2442 domain-containing protein [Tildeniella nuda ZEHNDER 1965/U140]|jgi:hypothetical protein|nr:DUF2442 domain-containing protein [Tildeniella nuda ZEHNDER 1965/U140]